MFVCVCVALFSECLARMGSDPLLVSAVGDDSNGRMITNHLGNLGMVHVCLRAREAEINRETEIEPRRGRVNEYR